jgi:hypothetical protein
MHRTTDSGETNILLLPFIFLFLFFVASAGFGVWAYMSRQTYRNNSTQMIADAVKTAKQQEDIVKDNQFAETQKQPLLTYTGPEQYGSVSFSYPRTWSGYVIDTASSGQPLDGYFHPGVVPSLNDQNSTYALRVQVISQSYSSIISGYSSAVTAKTLTATAYSFPKVPTVVGIRYDGILNNANGVNVSGSMVIMPVRDQTLKIWTETPNYLGDFNTYILPNVTFSP